jgi:hypothetical protein
MRLVLEYVMVYWNRTGNQIWGFLFLVVWSTIHFGNIKFHLNDFKVSLVCARLRGR